MGDLGGNKNRVSFFGPQVFVVKKPLGCSTIFGVDFNIPIRELSHYSDSDGFVINDSFCKNQCIINPLSDLSRFQALKWFGLVKSLANDHLAQFKPINVGGGGTGGNPLWRPVIPTLVTFYE